jgi:hydroxymethylbilane synthase
MLLKAQGLDSVLVPMSTVGDEGPPVADSPAGVKGLWTNEIERALLDGAIDLAVHSAKDLPATDADGVIVGAIPERADPTDVLVLRDGGELTDGLRIGTSSLRRTAQIRAAHPGVEVVPIHGNVPTRLAKMGRGSCDAVILAAAGLARLDLAPPNATPLGIDIMLPAPGQGALAIQCRAEDRTLQATLILLDHRASRLAFEAERALMRELGGGCALPLGALAAQRGDLLRLAAVVATPDGARVVRAAAEADEPERVANMVASLLRADGADEILAAVTP